METYLLATLGLPNHDREQDGARRERCTGQARGGIWRASSAQRAGRLFAARARVDWRQRGHFKCSRRDSNSELYTYGTQAHSWVMAHEDEADAFAHFLDAFPERAFLLLDTYNVHDAVKKIIGMGRKPAGVRLDSGDVAKDSRWVRRELDRAGWQDVRIFASGDLDEDKIAELLAKGAAIDSFGVGSALATPGDAPHLNLVYKLVEVDRAGKIQGAAKLTQAKVTYPGRKQVFRYSNRAGEFEHDRIALEGEPANGGAAAAGAGDAEGKRTAPPEPITALHDRCVAELARLPERYRRIDRQRRISREIQQGT